MLSVIYVFGVSFVDPRSERLYDLRTLCWEINGFGGQLDSQGNNFSRDSFLNLDSWVLK